VIAVSLAAGIAALFTAVAVRYACVIFKWLPRQQRWERCMQGRCACCGYDLTANTSGTCPECGASIGQMIKASAPSGPSVIFDPQPWWVWAVVATVMIVVACVTAR
jgi:hypothetical protein